MTRFEVGRTYSCRSFCDYDCIWSFEIVSRTEKTVVIKATNRDDAPPERRKVRPWGDAEHIDPLGRYSMSPVLSADGKP